MRARAAKRLKKIKARLGGAKTREEVRDLVALDHAQAASQAGGAKNDDGNERTGTHDDGGEGVSHNFGDHKEAALNAGVGDARTVEALLPEMVKPDAFKPGFNRVTDVSSTWRASCMKVVSENTPFFKNSNRDEERPEISQDLKTHSKIHQ